MDGSEFKGPIRHPLEIQNENLKRDNEVLYRDSVAISQVADELRLEVERLTSKLEIYKEWGDREIAELKRKNEELTESAKVAEAMVATAHPPKMIRDLVSKLQAAEAEVEDAQRLSKIADDHIGMLQAEVARLREALEGFLAAIRFDDGSHQGEVGIVSWDAIAAAAHHASKALEVKP